MPCSRQFWGEVKPALEAALADGLDAIHLSLHGAMVTDRRATIPKAN